MAENIGKIVVAIEAEVAELRRGLAQAEAEFKKSADKLVVEQKNLTSKFKKSWVELSAKINVVTTALNVAGGVLRGITGAMEEFGKEGASSAEKVGGAIQAFGDAGIPIVSQVIGVAEGLAEVFVQSAARIREVEEELKRFNDSILRIAQRRRQGEQADEMSHFVDGMATRMEILKNQLSDEQSLEFQSMLRRAHDRVTLEKQLQKQILSMGAVGESAELMFDAKRVALELFDFETELLQKKIQQETERRQEALKKQAEAEKKALEAKVKAEEDAQKRIADKTQDLQTRLAIMLAKQAGDEDKARTIAIEARYRKMKEGATVAQKAIIDQMQAIEMSGTGGGTTGGGDGTTGISTAIGSFTIATGNQEVKKQTSLLKKIAESNQKVADAVTKTARSGGIIIAS